MSSTKRALVVGTRTPFKVVAHEEPDGAEIKDRVTGETIGYVLRWAQGWSAYLDVTRGHELLIGFRPASDMEREIFGVRRIPLYATRYRKDAAFEVWKSWRCLQDA